MPERVGGEKRHEAVMLEDAASAVKGLARSTSTWPHVRSSDRTDRQATHHCRSSSSIPSRRPTRICGWGS